jgi:hypothetical protein
MNSSGVAGVVIVQPGRDGPVADSADRRGAVTIWAGIGAVWVAIAAQAVIRWILSPGQFAPAPVRGPDVYPVWREISLRVLEGVSFAVLLAFVWYCVVKPWRRDRALSLDGKFVIGGLFGAVADGFLNQANYLFAWNQHSVNVGVWSAFLPFHDSSASSRYAEGLLWGVPMYIYFCTGAAIVGCRLIMWLRERFPGIGDALAYVVVFAVEFGAGFVLENVIIRTTQAYGYAKTAEALTLWHGAAYQFPVYESLFTAGLGVAYTYVRMSALESVDGVSCVERGYHRWPPALRAPVRLLAVVGFSFVALITIYHLPLNWLGVTGRSVAHLPSYLLPG